MDESGIQAVRDALAPHLGIDRRGRNVFEGVNSNRVYALLAKSPVFAEMVTHPLALAFAEAELGTSCLLSACLAINLLPGESTQPWHCDDAHIDVPPPHGTFGISTFWAIDETTADNGATQVLPTSHKWSKAELQGKLSDRDFEDSQEHGVDHDPGAHPDAIAVPMPAGSLMIAKGHLWHRGGANRSDDARLIVTPQYCAGWARPLESMLVAVPPEVVASYPQRVQELIGYSIHPPFMGYADGMHPRRQLNASA